MTGAVETTATRLSSHTSSTVVDAMIRLKLYRPASTVMTGLKRLTGPRGCVVGRARTQQFGLERDRGAAALVADRVLHFRLVDEAEEGDILVLAAPGAGNFAIFGGILAAKAAARGVRGVVVDGFTRDLDECDHYGLTVWARGHTPIPGGHGDYSVTATNVPVSCAGISVRPADWVIADSDGVVVVPAGDIAAVLDACDAIVASEQDALNKVEQGLPLREAYPSRSYYKEAT